jgi:ribosome recycling factor
MVSPWDRGLLASIEKAIASSGLNLSPVVDGAIIRIVVPALTAERRQEMVKLLHQRIEEGKVMLRNIRMAAKKDIDEQKGEAGISEDTIAADLKQLEDAFQAVMKQVDTLAADKEKELTTL